MRQKRRDAIAQYHRITLAKLLHRALRNPSLPGLRRRGNERRARFARERRVIADSGGLQRLRHNDDVIHQRARHLDVMRVQGPGRDDLPHLGDHFTSACAGGRRLHEGG